MKYTRFLQTVFFWCLALCMQAQQKEHIVQRGEDFSTIARTYAITQQELMDANPTYKVCYAGLKLIIPQHGVPMERKKVAPKPLDIELLSSDKEVVTQSTATAYQIGQALWKYKNYSSASAYLQAALNDGDLRACYPLANCYEQDTARCYDIYKAVDCYHKAVTEIKNKSDEGYWKSCGALANLYQQGLGVDKDLSLAKKFCKDYQRYADKASKKKADRLMSSILSEERSK